MEHIRPKKQLKSPFLSALRLGIVGSTTVVGLFGYPAEAQITPDNTLPISSTVTTSGNSVQITGGTQSGTHLFHSFESFSIGSGETVSFDHALDLSSVITRVTGASISTIDGILSTQGTADFFLLNPNGIVFGENATLNVGGSFMASTADSLQFDNGSSFSAIVPQAPPLLTVNGPTGLQYGQQPGAITVNGPGHNLTIDADTLAVITSDRPSGLQVNARETLALLGGPITVDGGNLTAESGRIILNSVGTANQVGLTADALGWTLDSSEVNQQDNISLQNAASLLTSGDGGGAVDIRGQQIGIEGGGTILANTLGNRNGKGATLVATEMLTLSGLQFDADGAAIFPSSLFAEVGLDATGTGGDVELVAPSIFIRGGAQVSTSVFGGGNGGNVTLHADDAVLLSGNTDAFGASGMLMDVADFNATGKGGILTLETNQLTVTAGATISANTFGFGDGGNIRIAADDITVEGVADNFNVSQIIAQVEGSGNGGSIQIQGDRLRIQNGAGVTSEVIGAGQGSTIQIAVNDLQIAGISPDGFSSTISTLARTGENNTGGIGNSGAIDITANKLVITNGGEIRSSTIAEGNAGNITIEAPSIQLTGIENFSTGIFAVVDVDPETGRGGRGEGGQIRLQTEALSVEAGAQIASGTFGSGNANTIQITSDEIVLEGRNNRASSGIFASAIFGTGDGGTIDIDTQSLRVHNGATINASNFSSTNAAIPAGQGAAGNIFITAQDIQLSNQGAITTSTNVGDRGNISLNSELITLSDRAAITTNAQADATGGNISTNTDFLIANPNENSDITANAIRGRGGSIDITAQRIFGLEFREQLTPQSDITVSSEFGIDGEVIIDLLAIDSTSDLGKLPSGVVDEGDRVATGCPADTGANFIATGRGGLPDSLSQHVQSPLILHAFEREFPPNPWGLEEAKDLAIAVHRDTDVHPRAILEAQGWHYAANGSIELTTNASTVSDRPTPSLQPVACLRRPNV